MKGHGTQFGKKKEEAIIALLTQRSTDGRLVITIMGAVSQWEREALGERTRDALRHKRAQGYRSGNLPSGYHLAADGRTLELDATEQNAVSEIRKLRQEGGTLRGIASTLNAGGHRTRRGNDWRLESVVRV